jgi:hypothetical protein
MPVTDFGRVPKLDTDLDDNTATDTDTPASLLIP